MHTMSVYAEDEARGKHIRGLEAMLTQLRDEFENSKKFNSTALDYTTRRL